MRSIVAPILLAVLAIGAAATGHTARHPTPSELAAANGDIVPTHDPAMIRDGDWWYVYGTGTGEREPLTARRSRDLLHWKRLPAPLAAIPDWARSKVPGTREIWAPDLSRDLGGFRLYYAVSTFGGQRSVIGLATATTLDPSRADYGWRDQGLVVETRLGDDHNAIDPNFVVDRDGGAWLAFGSYWSGIKLVRLDPRTGKPVNPAAAPIAIAKREAGHDAIEAPFIVDHGGWYWLMVSLDHCCHGADSDYHVVAGRSRAITGPYLDRAGRPMLDGGGTDLVPIDPYDPARFKGPGHEGFARGADGRDWLVFHAYDAQDHGRPALRIARLEWDAAGWPYVVKAEGTAR